MLPDVSITTVLYNSADCLRDCFTSVEPDVRDGIAQLLVVDNASPDNSAEIVKAEFPFAELIVSKKNLGFAGGCNLSWSHVKGRYWLLLNPDAVVPPGGLRKLVKWMDEHQEIGAASPNIVNAKGVSDYPGRRFPAISLTLLEMLRLHLLLPAKLRGRILRAGYWVETDQVDADWVPGTAMIVRREAVEQVGLLSEELFMYGEDIEWCWRMRRAGWKIGVSDGVKVLHQGGTSAKQTWGEEETNIRMLRTIYEAVKIMRGGIYSRILLSLDATACLIESYNPRRLKSQRNNARKCFNALFQIWSVKKPDTE